MRKTSQILNTLTTAFISLSILISSNACAEVNVCAATQTYSALESIKDHAPVDFNVQYATAEDLESIATEDKSKCELILSSDEKLAVLLVRSGKLNLANIHQLVRAPLILWSADPSLLDSSATVVARKKLKSLALPKAELTPVGFATSEIVSRSNFPTDYLKHKIYRTEQEYQVYSLVEGGNVQAGFLTKPLIMDATGQTKGSFWQVPRELYSELSYYLMPLDRYQNDRDVQRLMNYLLTSDKVMRDFIAAGFDKPLSKK